ncbi:phage baseplate assembly protein V [Desulfuromonas acetoxidans]|uniref:phage baseplate assembly protein V n=1 Tax=Desulfuromonas acetoxidans TaxID=891 RepID=UPI002930D526|nr:phage baseplate assembly protein V [Desulfuromonas acetoxidans]
MNDDLAFRVAEIERRLANVLRVGTIKQLDDAAARVTVTIGNITTTWLPWLTRRAGEDRSWWAPEPGEQVMVLSPGGDLAQGVVLPSIYQSSYPAPATTRDKCRIEFKDGGFAEYDRNSGKLIVSAEGLVQIIGKGTVEVIGKDGGTVKGSVQGDCLCTYTGKPHPHISPTVKESF